MILGVALGGNERGDDWEAEREHIRAVGEAGADWWIEWMRPREPATMLERVERGPLRAA